MNEAIGIYVQCSDGANNERPLLMGSGINHTTDTSASHIVFGIEEALCVAVQSSLNVNIIPTGR